MIYSQLSKTWNSIHLFNHYKTHLKVSFKFQAIYELNQKLKFDYKNKDRKVHEAQVAANKSANKKKNETQNAEEEAEDEDIEEVDVSGAGNEEDNEVVENDENGDSSKSNKK